MSHRLRLETERLCLLCWRAGDWRQLQPIAQDSEVMRYISNGQPWTDEQIRGLVHRQIEGFAQRGFCLWRLWHKASGQMVGFCGLQPLAGTHEIEIGWWLARGWWTQGLATEAGRAAMRDGFSRVGLERIVAVAQPQNRASIHVMEKLGMTFESETTHRGFRVVLCAISRASWENSPPE
jgi:RimJ/RimL family protein N-acetyltransferase